MLRDVFDAPGERDPAELQREYERRIAEAVETVGVETAAAETGVPEETIDALLAGESPELLLTDAAALLALDSALPDADSIEAEARDILLLGMSIAVLDVEALAAGINDELEPKEIQQKAEGRYPMTVAEYALLHSYIESKK